MRLLRSGLRGFGGPVGALDARFKGCFGGVFCRACGAAEYRCNFLFAENLTKYTNRLPLDELLL